METKKLSVVISGEMGENYRFNNPRGVAFDSKGFMYITDSENGRIMVYDQNFTYVRTIKPKGWEIGIEALKEI